MIVVLDHARLEPSERTACIIRLLLEAEPDLLSRHAGQVRIDWSPDKVEVRVFPERVYRQKLPELKRGREASKSEPKR